MKKVLIGSIFILIILLCINGCNNVEKKENKNINKNEKEVLDKVVNDMIVLIDGKEYLIDLEDNETVKTLMNMLPLEIDMEELNGNEKYIFLDTVFPTNEEKFKRINAGDVMLYKNNCLVIFYKSFDSSYSYTKIGHIDNLPNLGNKNVTVIIKKSE